MMSLKTSLLIKSVACSILYQLTAVWSHSLFLVPEHFELYVFSRVALVFLSLLLLFCLMSLFIYSYLNIRRYYLISCVCFNLQDGSTGNAFLIMATTTSTDNSSISKLHKPFKDHKDKTPKDLKDPKSAFRDSGWEPGKAPKESSRKPKENQPLREINPKMGFKQPKSLSKERRTEGITHASRLNKRLSGLDGDDHGTKRRKKGFVNSSEMPISELDGQSLDKKLLRDRPQLHTSKLRAESEDADLRSASTLPPFQDLVDANDSDVEDQSARSDVSKRDALLLLQLGMSSSTGSAT